ncbi:MAG: response regulator [Spirochaetales bacterium]|nr:response regulator [Spirochaetales bacterium]
MSVNALFKKIILESPVGLVILGKNGKIHFSNKQFKSLIPKVEELKGYDFKLIIHPDDREKYVNDFNDLINGIKSSFSEDYRYENYNNKDEWFRFRVSSVQEDSDANWYVAAFIEDITAQRAYELQLKEEKGEAERSSQIKSDFLANMSHEIRTPIHTIIGMSELMNDTKLDKEQQEYAQQIEYSAEVLLGLINDILDFSKIEAGKLHIEEIDFDLYEMAENAVDMIALEAHKRGLETAIFIENQVPVLLKSDPVRLRQIVVNLFNNAVKFTHKGSIQVHIILVEDMGESVKLKISVVDTGIGIPLEKKEKLFKVFSQVDSSTTRKYGGSGLGLSISKNLAEMMGGEIGVDSEFGKGSTFWFTVVMRKQTDTELSTNLIIPKIDSKVLIVDDNKEIRGFLRNYLEFAGCTVYEVDDGSSALKFLRDRSGTKDQIDLCLIDLILPGMDGWQIASEIHSDDAISSVKRILLSPTGKSADEAKMKLLNWFDGYLHKPIKKKGFFAEILQVLNKSEEILDEISPVEELEELVELEDESIVAKILVAEDHAVNQMLFKTILENFGHDVDIANNGLEAVSAVKLKSYDVIFMDVQMPEMNGYEATIEIRKLGSKTPIIAVTASAIKGEKEKCISVGMTDFLTKPFKKKDIIPVLDKWLSKMDKTEQIKNISEEAAGVSDMDIFDFKQAVEVFMGKEHIVTNLLKGFIIKVEDQIKNMYSNFENGDFDALRQDAHSIKGGSSNLYINRLSSAAKNLESAAVENDSGCKVLIDKVKKEFDEFLIVKNKITG